MQCGSVVEIDAVAEIGAVIGVVIGAGVRVRIDETKMVDALTMPRF